MPVLARDRVRYAGEPIALVAAETQQIADDAAELVQVEYEQLPGVFDPRLRCCLARRSCTMTATS